jgi:hypothetical protein
MYFPVDVLLYCCNVILLFGCAVISAQCWLLAEDFHLCDSVACGAFPPFLQSITPHCHQHLMCQKEIVRKTTLHQWQSPYWLVLITIKLLDHYGNIKMIPVKFIVDVDMKRTLHDELD